MHRRRARRLEVASQPFRPGPKNGRLLEQETGVDTVEQTRRTFEAAARLAAKLKDGKRERAVTHGSRPQPAPAEAPPHTQQPGIQHGVRGGMPHA
ncbi:hypothetical protein [Streptomyces sp. NPDC016675]|uniref:hypothetical protein n=1 Tax=Streptomyces sp. NPDC016675 TaxID=3364970 RepID=UPI0037002FB7